MSIQDINALRLTAKEATDLQNAIGAKHPASKFLANAGPADELGFRTRTLKVVNEAMKAELESIRLYKELQQEHGILESEEDLKKQLASANLANRDLQTQVADSDKARLQAIAKNAMAVSS